MGPKVKILVPVKADAYGHGIIPVSRRLEALAVDYLGVASIDEGIILREAGIKVPILVLSPILAENVKVVLDYGLTQTVCTKELALSLNREAKKNNITANIHIKVDTGMHRVGVAHTSAYVFIQETALLPNLKIEGIFTHFPCADDNPAFTRRQIGMFERLIKRLEQANIRIPLKHSSNSLGVIDYPRGHFNMVRPGLMIYGLYPKERLKIKLRPVLSLKTRVSYLKVVAKGSGISYGHTYITKRKMKIATLPIGYGDGYPCSLSNQAYCLIGGDKVKIIGRICMDQLMVDVTKIKKVRIGSPVVLVGFQKAKGISVEDLAKLAGTISYEIACGLGNRVPRIYIG